MIVSFNFWYAVYLKNIKKSISHKKNYLIFYSLKLNTLEWIDLRNEFLNFNLKIKVLNKIFFNGLKLYNKVFVSFFYNTIFFFFDFLDTYNTLKSSQKYIKDCFCSFIIIKNKLFYIPNIIKQESCILKNNNVLASFTNTSFISLHILMNVVFKFYYFLTYYLKSKSYNAYSLFKLYLTTIRYN